MELWRATGDRSYLALVHDAAEYMIANETRPTPAGRVLYDGSAFRCTEDCPLFKAMSARYLRHLVAEDPRPEYEEVLSASARAVWSIARDSSGLFGGDWDARGPKGRYSVEATIAAETALAAWPAESTALARSPN